jgi:hypothetical protein
MVARMQSRSRRPMATLLLGNIASLAINVNIYASA